MPSYQFRPAAVTASVNKVLRALDPPVSYGHLKPLCEELLDTLAPPQLDPGRTGLVIAQAAVSKLAKANLQELLDLLLHPGTYWFHTRPQRAEILLIGCLHELGGQSSSRAAGLNARRG
jgi:hypothetical protein